MAIEAVISYPNWLYRAAGHPVTWMGWIIAALDRHWNRDHASAGARRAMGIAALAVLLCITAAATIGFSAVMPGSLIGLAVSALIASSLIAQRSLDRHVAAVATALTSDLAAGRRAVAMIVGRNPDVLDQAGVARAAIESLAENFSDGIVAPVFWLAMAGLPGAAIYKAANTADSMIGHRTPRFNAYGWAAARLDDVLNLPASRLAALLLILAAPLAGGSAPGAIRSVWRDAGRHRSPNAGWPEAAMAGALGLQLAGPRVYGDALVEDAFMGNGKRDASAADITRALRLYRVACLLQFGLWLAVCFIGRAIWR